jgi:hypothetical protein
MPDPLPQSYTLVRAANGDLLLVSEGNERTINIRREFPPLQLQIDNEMSPQADDAVSALFATVLGSGVKVRVPKIFD